MGRIWNYLNVTAQFLNFHKWPLLAGFAIILLYMFPFYYFGEKAYIQIWDHLDCLYVPRILQNAIFPDSFYNGITILSGYDLSVKNPLIYDWAYLIFSPYYAMIVQEHFYRIIGFAGMYILLNSLNRSRLAATIASTLFATLPFIYHYQGSLAIIPLYLCVLLYLYKRESPSWLIYILAIYISLILPPQYTGCWLHPVSFATVSFLFLRELRCLKTQSAEITGWKKRVRNTIVFYLLMAIGALIQLWPMLNASPLHREEFAATKLAPSSSITVAINLFTKGMDHVISYNGIIILLAITSLIVGGIFSYIIKSTDVRNLTKKQIIATLFVLSFILISALFSNTSVIDFMSDHVVKGFSFNRIYWLLPIPLTISFFYSILIFIEIFRAKKAIYSIIAFSLACLVISGYFYKVDNFHNHLHQPVINNYKQFLLPDNQKIDISYDLFFDQKIFEEIRRALPQNRAEYRIGSIGLYPSIAAYGGFSTIDAYSIAYPLKYKHLFSSVIQKELDRDKAINDYFWMWGSRCYLFSAELGRQYLTPKNQPPVSLAYNTEVLKQLNCRYIFSAVPIANYRELSWSYINCFSTPESLYEIYVYHVF